MTAIMIGGRKNTFHVLFEVFWAVLGSCDLVRKHRWGKQNGKDCV